MVDPTPAKANKNGNGSAIPTAPVNAQPCDSRGDNGFSPTKHILAAIRIALTLFLLYFAGSYGYSLLSTAYDIRMHAIRTYGYIIHEVRTTERMHLCCMHASRQ